MKEKGFTLIELLGTVVLLGIIAVIVYPMILKQYKSSKNDISTNKKNMIVNAAKDYVEDNLNEYTNNDVNEITKCINVTDLKDYSTIEIDDDLSKYKVEVKISTANKKTYDVIEDCRE